MERPFGAVPLLGAALLTAALLGLACGGNSNNKPASATRPPATQAQAPGTSGPGGTQPPPAGSVASGTPAPTPPTCASQPSFVASAQKLSPLLLQNADLTPDLQNLVAATTGAIAICNQDYAAGLPNATLVAQRLDKDGRLSGVRMVWNLKQQYTPGLKAVYVLDDDIEEFSSTQGAVDGLALIFENVNQQQPNRPGASPIKSAQLAGVSPLGEEMRAYRLEQTLTTGVGNSVSQLQNVTQVTYIVGWRRGTAVGTITISAVNEDPSLDDVNRLASLQDARLKAAGFGTGTPTPTAQQP